MSKPQKELKEPSTPAEWFEAYITDFGDRLMLVEIIFTLGGYQSLRTVSNVSDSKFNEVWNELPKRPCTARTDSLKTDLDELSEILGSTESLLTLAVKLDTKASEADPLYSVERRWNVSAQKRELMLGRAFETVNARIAKERKVEIETAATVH